MFLLLKKKNGLVTFRSGSHEFLQLGPMRQDLEQVSNRFTSSGHGGKHIEDTN